MPSIHPIPYCINCTNHIKGSKFREKNITASTTASKTQYSKYYLLKMSFKSFKILSIYTVELLIIFALKCGAEEPCETIPTEIHVTKGL